MATELKRLFDFPYYQLEQFPKSDALCSKVDGKWKPYSTQEFIDHANAMSRGLLKLGINPGDKIGIICTVNRPEWNMTDIGVLQTGAIDVPIYPTISSEDYEYILNHSECKVCFVSDKVVLDKLNAIKDNVPTLKHIYTYDKIEGATNWSEMLDSNNEIDQAEVEKRKDAVKTEDLATLIYTSGTTGKPKGVMISHKNIASNSIASTERLPVNEYAKALSFLPVCHVYERMIHYLYMMNGVSIYFAESMETIGDNLRETQPNVFTAVPRLLEKVYDKIVTKGAAAGGIKTKLFFWALNLGLRYEVNGANGAWYEFQLKIARKLIFSKWKEALGGKCEVIASGSAALQPRLARVFHAAGLPVMEGYGLTETSPVISVNCSDNDGVRFGTVGRKLNGVEVKIAEDGEICAKGDLLMMGYYKDEEKTKEVIDSEGWFHTGDIGCFVDGDFLKITDRKKEIFKTSGGKYIAPQQMENKYKESRFIEQIMVIGENKKHPAALIVPAFAFVEEWCKLKNISISSTEELIKNEKVITRINEELESFNSQFGKWEQVKKFELIDHEWTVDTEELTPTMKLKRKNIMAKYTHLVEKIYGPAM
ncbi:long-chain fatty acid--CoA ligase [bacterium]|nr:long-chain fatty acid--CoA ligase [bacterium]